MEPNIYFQRQMIHLIWGRVCVWLVSHWPRHEWIQGHQARGPNLPVNLAHRTPSRGCSPLTVNDTWVSISSCIKWQSQLVSPNSFGSKIQRVWFQMLTRHNTARSLVSPAVIWLLYPERESQGLGSRKCDYGITRIGAPGSAGDNAQLNSAFHLSNDYWAPACRARSILEGGRTEHRGVMSGARWWAKNQGTKLTQNLGDGKENEPTQVGGGQCL